MKVENIWVITDNAASIPELTSAAAVLGNATTLVFAGEEACAVGADKAYWLGELNDSSFINYLPTIVSLVKEAQPQLVLTGNSVNDRLAASFIGAAFGTAVISDATELSVDESGVVGKRMTYGGAAFKTEVAKGSTAVAVLSPGVFEIQQLPAAKTVEKLEKGESGVKFVEKRIREGKAVNLSLSKRVFAVGRGVPSQESLKTIEELAAILGCDVGCTRPIADETDWMPRETYIGVSGVMMKPDFYMGIGLSGQVQHTVGISTSKTIFAINKDVNAPIFSQCDYGIVGDLTEIVPALIEKLK